MSTEMCLYLEIDLICVSILMILSYNLRTRIGRLIDDRLFEYVTSSAAIILLADAGYAVFSERNSVFSVFMNYFCNSVFLFMAVFTSALWFLFTDYKLNPSYTTLKRNIKIIIAPIAIMLILVLTNYHTHALFYFDVDNNYVRGKHHFVLMAFSYFFMLFSAVKAFVRGTRTSDPNKRREAMTLASFVILPLIGGIIQAINYELPLTWAGATLSFLVIFINIQNQQISHDALTGINNRRQLNKYLDMKLEDNAVSSRLFLILIDIDRFKQINDTYGHVEGDAALIKIAEILVKVCGNKRDFPARYGGDEFAVVCERKSEEELMSVINDINALIERENELNGSKYCLSLSMGYTRFCPKTMKTQDKLISAADDELYKIKASHHNLLK